jgi:phi13 family phage major tail protein
MESHTDGSEAVYGTGRVVQEAISATLSYTSDPNAVLYGDDRIVDMDDGITGYTLSFNPTGLKDADRAAILGEEVNTDGSQEITDAAHPWGGFGFFRVMRDGDNTANYYEALWCRKVKFRLPSEETRTKEGTIQWRTPTMEGTGAGLFVDSGDHAKYIKHKTFDTASAAKAWLDELAHVSAVTT